MQTWCSRLLRSRCSALASEAEGLDYVTSVSRQGVSIIQAYMSLNYDPYDALAEIQGKIASERNSLPREAEDPVISLSTSEGWALVYLALVGETMNTAQMTDYTLRSVVPRLQALPGVAKAGINGDQTMALRRVARSHPFDRTRHYRVRRAPRPAGRECAIGGRANQGRQRQNQSVGDHQPHHRRRIRESGAAHRGRHRHTPEGCGGCKFVHQ